MMKTERITEFRKYVSGLLSGGKPDYRMIAGGGTFSEAAPFLQDNEVLFQALSSLDEKEKNEPHAASMLSDQDALFERAIDYYSEISEAFKEKGLRFFAMKSFRSYSYADEDLDMVLVDPERREECIETLEELGFEFLWNRSILREPYKRFYVRKSGEGAPFLPKIHVHFAVSWNGMVFLDASEIWERMKTLEIRGREVMVPSPEDEILIMAAHAIGENGYVTIGELLHLKTILRISDKIDIGYVVKSAKKHNWLKGLVSFLLLADSYYKNLTGENLLTGDLGGLTEGLSGAGYDMKGEAPPYFFPAKALSPVYTDKIAKDVCSGRLLQLPRELFTFGLVIWLFRNKKRTKFYRNLPL
ncbi:MAG: nucleotidyltransferase family protein [Candidatus Omnitrophota bacterium]